MLANGGGDERTDVVGRDVLGSNLKDARLGGFREGQDRRQIQVMSEDDEGVRSGVLHDRHVSGPRVADR